MEEVRMSCLSHRCSVSLLNKNPEPYTLNPFPAAPFRRLGSPFPWLPSPIEPN